MTTLPINSLFAGGQTDLAMAQALSSEQRAVIRAVNAVNSSGAYGSDHQLTYSIDRSARLVIVRLVDKTTGAVLDQIPNQYLVRMAEELYKD